MYLRPLTKATDRERPIQWQDFRYQDDCNSRSSICDNTATSLFEVAEGYGARSTNTKASKLDLSLKAPKFRNAPDGRQAN
jgi:hypothetical protein